MGGACITKARTPNVARTNRSFKSLAPRVETEPVSTMRHVGSVVGPQTMQTTTTQFVQPVTEVMEVVQPMAIEQPVIYQQPMMVQQPMYIQQVAQPPPTIYVSQQPQMMQIPMQQQSIMATIAQPPTLVSSTIMPSIVKPVTTQVVNSAIEVLPQRPTLTIQPPQPPPMRTTVTYRQQPQLVQTVYATSNEPPMASPPGQRSMRAQSSMSFRPGGSITPSMAPIMTGQSQMSRLLQNDIVNSENFNPTIYSPQCMDMKSRSIVFS